MSRLISTIFFCISCNTCQALVTNGKCFDCCCDAEIRAYLEDSLDNNIKHDVWYRTLGGIYARGAITEDDGWAKITFPTSDTFVPIHNMEKCPDCFRRDDSDPCVRFIKSDCEHLAIDKNGIWSHDTSWRRNFTCGCTECSGGRPL